jgi:hypothetical protein
MDVQFYCNKAQVSYATTDFLADKVSILGIRTGHAAGGNLISIDMGRIPDETESAFWARAKSYIDETIKSALGCQLLVSSFSVSYDGLDSVVETDATGHEQLGDKFFCGEWFLTIGVDGVQTDYFSFKPTIANTGNVLSSNSYLAQQNAAIFGFSE